MKKAVSWLGITLALVGLSYFISPKLLSSTCKQATGRVSAVYADATKTLHVRLSGNARNFMMPAGKLKQNVVPAELLGKEVRISYHDARRALDAGTSGEIASISMNTQLLYSE